MEGRDTEKAQRGRRSTWPSNCVVTVAVSSLSGLHHRTRIQFAGVLVKPVTGPNGEIRDYVRLHMAGRVADN